MVFTPVYMLNPKTLLGYLEDLTIRGARVVGGVPLEADKLVTLVIEFPKDTASLPPEPFTIQARGQEPAKTKPATKASAWNLRLRQ